MKKKRKILSKEHKRKISEAMTGKKLSQVTRERMSEAAKGKKLSQVTRERMSKAKKGTKLSLEHKRKISENSKKMWLSAGFKKRMSKVLRGVKRSEETKKKISEATKGENNPNWGEHHSDETRKKMSEALKGKKHPNWGKRPWNKGKKFSEKTKRKMSEAHQKLWANNPEYRRKRLERLSKMPFSDTKIERAVRQILQDLGIKFQQQKWFSTKKHGGCIADFYLPRYESIIECDGEYWHSRLGAKERDRQKNRLYCSLGLKIVRLKEKTILKNSTEKLTKIILKKIGMEEVLC